MLKQSSIIKMKQSQYQSKVNATNNQYQRLKEKQNIINVKHNNSRNLNRVVLNQSETILHNYAKFIVSLACIKSNPSKEFLTEYQLQNVEIDIWICDEQIAIECESKGNQDSKVKQKFDNYDNLIQLGIVKDLFIIPLENFTGNLKKDMMMVRYKLGI